MKSGKGLFTFLSLLILTVFFLAGQVHGAEHKVSMKNWLFNPKVLTVEVGDSVIWVNEDDTMHNIYFDDNLPEAPQQDEPEKIRVRKKFIFKFDKAGEYNYYCKNHRDYDMLGKIIVKGK